MIHVNGSPRTKGLRRRQLVAWLQDLMRREGCETGEVSLTFVDTATMSALNERYTGRDGTTDVLAFSLQEGDYPAPDPDLLGDVVVDIAQVRAQACAFGVPTGDEVLRVVAHGFLHLLGYDHTTDAEAARMRAVEERLILMYGRRQEP